MRSVGYALAVMQSKNESAEKGELATVKKSRYPEMRRRRAAGQSQEMDLVQSLLWSGTALPASIRQTWKAVESSSRIPAASLKRQPAVGGSCS